MRGFIGEVDDNGKCWLYTHHAFVFTFNRDRVCDRPGDRVPVVLCPTPSLGSSSSKFSAFGEGAAGVESLSLPFPCAVGQQLQRRPSPPLHPLPQMQCSIHPRCAVLLPGIKVAFGKGMHPSRHCSGNDFNGPGTHPMGGRRMLRLMRATSLYIGLYNWGTLACSGI